MKQDTLKTYLGLYGADLELWPTDMRLQVEKDLLQNPKLQNIIDEEKAFEALLHSSHVDAPSKNLADRIIAQAKPHTTVQKPSLWNKLSDKLDHMINWHPAAVALATLIIGIIIGYNTPTNNSFTEFESDSFLSDQGDIFL